MANTAPEMGQGEKTLTRAAGLVADAKTDFDGFSRRLDAQIAGLQGRWAWTEKQDVITRALNEFEASLVSTEQDNVATDDAQSALYHRTAGRLG